MKALQFQLRVLLVLSFFLSVGGRAQSHHRHASGTPPQTTKTRFDSPDATFANAAPIIYARCTTCHRTGGPAPFPLETYDQIKAKAPRLLEAIRTGAMPPWTVKQKGVFKEDLSLEDHERGLLESWLANDAPAGDLSKAPPVPKFKAAGEWERGEPDLILTTPKYKVKAGGEDEYRTFVIPTHFKEDKYVVGVQYQPGSTKTVHHIFSLVSSGLNNFLLDGYDLADPGPGFSSKGTFAKFRPTGDLSGFIPGSSATFVDDGVARKIPKGSKIATEIHYTPSGQPEEDQTKIGLYFAKTPPKHLVQYEPMWADFKGIPPGAKNFEISTQWTTPKQNIRVVTLSPHMHKAGRRITMSYETPDGKSSELITIDPWDFHYQRFYHPRNSIDIPAGSRVRLTCTYDNPTDRTIRMGFDSSDEMCVGYLAYHTLP